MNKIFGVIGIQNLTVSIIDSDLKLNQEHLNLALETMSQAEIENELNAYILEMIPQFLQEKYDEQIARDAEVELYIHDENCRIESMGRV